MANKQKEYSRRHRRRARGLPEDAPLYAGTRGANNPRATLSDGQIKKARQLHEQGHTVTGLAEKFGITKGAMSKILRGLSRADN
jgi:hypothetical protein